MKTLKEIQEYFDNDKYATATTGIVITEASQGYAKVELSLDERHRNARGAIMGAVYFTMADFAFAVATNGQSDEAGVVTLDSSIRFISVPKGEKLYAEANITKDGRSVCFSTIKITDDTGRAICEVSSTGYKVNS